jgi:hypothetical protein
MNFAEFKSWLAKSLISIGQVLGLEKRLRDLEAGGGGPATDHAVLSHLDYATSGHTGFMATTTIPDQLSDLSDDATHRLVADTEKGTWNGKQEALGFTPENVANKSTDGTMVANSTTLYPSQSAVVTYVATHAGGGGTLPGVEVDCGTFASDTADIDCGVFESGGDGGGDGYMPEGW